MGFASLTGWAAVLGLAAASSPALADLEAARGFARGMAQELQLEPAECPQKVIKNDRGEEHVCGRTDLAFRKFAEVWDAAAPRQGIRGIKQFGRWRADYNRHGQQQAYEIQGTPLDVIYVTKGKTVVISYSDYSWNAWPCPETRDFEADGLRSAEDGEVRGFERIAGEPAEYPELARVARQQASLRLEAIIDEQGQVSDVCVREMHNRDVGFEEAAVRAVKDWRYTPGTVNGEPTRIFLEVTVDFKLR